MPGQELPLEQLREHMDPETLKRAEAMEAELAALQQQRNTLFQNWQAEKQQMLGQWEKEHEEAVRHMAASRSTEGPPQVNLQILSPGGTAITPSASTAIVTPVDQRVDTLPDAKPSSPPAAQGDPAADPAVAKLQAELEQARQRRQQVERQLAAAMHRAHGRPPPGYTAEPPLEVCQLEHPPVPSTADEHHEVLGTMQGQVPPRGRTWREGTCAAGRAGRSLAYAASGM